LDFEGRGLEQITLNMPLTFDDGQLGRRAAPLDRSAVTAYRLQIWAQSSEMSAYKTLNGTNVMVYRRSEALLAAQILFGGLNTEMSK
jgi:hypothetical protein